MLMKQMKEKGVVDVVTIISVLLMAAVLAGSFAFWGTRTSEQLQEKANKTLGAEVSGISANINVEAASGRQVTIRNIGSSGIANETLTVYVDGQLARCQWDTKTVGQNSVATCRDICIQ